MKPRTQGGRDAEGGPQVGDTFIRMQEQSTSKDVDTEGDIL